MMRKVFTALCLGLLITAAPAFAGRRASTGVTLRDAATDCIKSDGEMGLDGSVEYVNNVEGVNATLDSMGYAEVRLRYAHPNTYTRHVTFDFSMTLDYGYDGSPSAEHVPPFALGQPVRTDWEVMPVGVEGGLQGMSVGQVAPCAVTFDIHPVYLHEHWWLEFNNAACPGSSYATVTRLSETSWAIEAAPGDVASLMVPGKNAPGNAPAPMSDSGYYSMPFRMVIRAL